MTNKTPIPDETDVLLVVERILAKGVNDALAAPVENYKAAILAQAVGDARGRLNAALADARSSTPVGEVAGLVERRCSCAEVAGEDPRCIMHGHGTMWAKENPDICELAERLAALSANPTPTPAGDIEGLVDPVFAAVVDGRLALANWQKYNGEKADEVVYQAEKVATALQGLLAALQSPALVQGDRGEMVAHLYGPHEWGYRDPVEGGFIADGKPFEAADALTADAALIASLQERVDELTEGLTEIAKWEPKPFDFPSDWSEQIDGCTECQRYKGHPIQRGICDEHRRPLWDREKHDKHQEVVRGYEAQRIARDLLARSLLKEQG